MRDYAVLAHSRPRQRGSIAREGHAQVPDMDAPSVARLRESVRLSSKVSDLDCPVGGLPRP